MGLKSLIQGVVSSAFGALGDLATTVTYNRVSTQGSYNPTTGAMTDTLSTVTVQAVLAQYSQAEVEANPSILATDRKMLVRPSSLTYPPQPTVDTVSISGETWVVMSFAIDPADAVYVVQLRRP